MGSETTAVCSSLDTGGTPTAGGWVALLRGLDAAALSHPPGQGRGQHPVTIARHLGDASPSVRHALHAFDARGLASLPAQSRRPNTPAWLRHAAKRAQLRALLHQRPRPFGKPRRTWTLVLAAAVCWEQGLTPYHVSLEHIRQALKRLDIRWPRAKSWITSPDPP